MLSDAHAGSTQIYEGSELELFQHARNWKRYLRTALQSVISGDVAEVGAGIGFTTENLAFNHRAKRWLCIEPDAAQCNEIRTLRDSGRIPEKCEIWNGKLCDLPARATFDTIIYIDVLEHIEDDRSELEAAMIRLKHGGRLVVLAPAYQYLYSAFDESIGHFRRYTLSSLRAVAPEDLTPSEGYYLDSFGLLASLANKWILKQPMPTPDQISTWDRLLVPISRLTDHLVFRSFGRSAICVWDKN
ncbi:MAG: class I SAM-dependent methyltransferase [Pseudomonadota bacterium]